MPFQTDATNHPERSAYVPGAEQPDLNDAVARLKEFRSTWNPGDVIDEESALTAADLDVILSFIADFPSSD